MEIKIKKLSPDAVIPYKTYDNDFCFDMVPVSVEEVAPDTYRYHFGIAIELPDEVDGNGVCVTIRPRSSVWKTGMLLTNCEGTIDAGYRGEITAIFYHYDPRKPKYEINGKPICQMHIELTPRTTFCEVEELNDSERGCGGYGHTDNIKK